MRSATAASPFAGRGAGALARIRPRREAGPHGPIFIRRMGLTEGAWHASIPAVVDRRRGLLRIGVDIGGTPATPVAA